MKSEDPVQSDEALRQVLHQWKFDAHLPAHFQERVWRQIERTEAQVHVPAWMLLAIPPIQFVIESSWYAFVAMVMSSPAPRSVYLRAQTWIDRAAGCVLGALGLRLILEGAKEAG